MDYRLIALGMSLIFALSPHAEANWFIRTPATGAGPFSHDSGGFCKGETEDAGEDWECRIVQTFANGTIESAVSGTSFLEDPDEDDATWEGTVAAPANGGWAPKTNYGPATVSATIRLINKETDLIEDEHQISFEY
jgi:hypothetical protein